MNAEIVSAEGFDYDGIFVHYFIDLPLGWSVVGADEDTFSSQLSGMTQRAFSAADVLTGEDVAHFSHAFTADFLFDVNRFDLNGEALPKWPQIFFEVVSVDSWSRVRAEGYASAAVPYAAGCHDFSLPTWRPLRPGPAGELRRYFVGGAPELEDLSYAGIPGDVADGKILSRFGFRTITSGSIR